MVNQSKSGHNWRRALTLRKSAKQQPWQNREAVFRTIFEKSPTAICLIGPNNHYVDVNKAAEKLFGYSRSELLTHTFADLTHPDERRRDMEQAKRLMSGEIKVYRVDKRYIRRDGKVIYCRVSASGIFSETGSFEYILSLIEDITEHVAWMRKLEESERRYANLVENSNDGIIVIQAQKIVFANQRMADLVGVPLAKTIGQPMLKYVAPSSRALIADRYVRRLKGEPVDARYEFELQRANGQIIPVDINASVIEYDGKMSTMSIIRDITKAKEIDRMKSEFVTIASHQLRTPLSNIKWLTELVLKDQQQYTPAQLELLHDIAKSNERMITLVNDLLSVSRIETGKKFNIEKKPSSIVDVISAVVDGARALAQEKRVKIVYHPCAFSKKHLLPLDTDKISQAISNILVNAIKYSPENSTITISCSDCAKGLNITIKDRGIGIPLKQQARVFEKFFRADNVQTVAPEGTGLGLYIAKSIIEAHGGTISFVSKEGKGTAFTIKLPNLRSKK